MTGAMSMLDGRGFVPADFDRDGDLDFFVTNNNQRCVYLENRQDTGRSWSVVQLRGTTDNAFGIGAKVRLTAAVDDGEPTTQLRQIHIGSGYLSSPAPEACFGLGGAETIARLEVVWPSGQRQVFDNVDTRRIVVVHQERGLEYRDLDAPAGAGILEASAGAGTAGPEESATR